MSESRSRLTARKINIEDVINGNYYQQDGFDPNYVITPYGLRVSRGRILGIVVDTYVNDDESYGAITIDDGTETMRAKFFQELDMMEGVEEGDVVEVVGKIKQYNDETYINPELIVQRGPTFELLRALELKEVRETWREHVEMVKQLQDAGKSEEDIVQELAGNGLNPEEVHGILQYLDLGDAFNTGGQTGGNARITTAPTHPTAGNGSEAGSGNDEENSVDHRGIVLEAIETLDDGDGADYGDIQDETGLDEEEMEDAVNDLLSDGTCYEPRPGRIKKL